MPYVEVWVDAVDLSDFSDDDLRAELATRRDRNALRGRAGLSEADYSIPKIAARETLNEAADEFRKAGKVSLAFKLEEIREDFVGQ